MATPGAGQKRWVMSREKSIALPFKHSCSGFFRNIGYIRNIAAHYPTAQSRVRSPVQLHEVKSGAFA